LYDRTKGYRPIGDALHLRGVVTIESIEELDQRFEPEAVPNRNYFETGLDSA
jgi:hypothetical protein